MSIPSFRAKRAYLLLTDDEHDALLEATKRQWKPCLMGLFLVDIGGPLLLIATWLVLLPHLGHLPVGARVGIAVAVLLAARFWPRVLTPDTSSKRLGVMRIAVLRRIESGLAGY